MHTVPIRTGLKLALGAYAGIRVLDLCMGGKWNGREREVQTFFRTTTKPVTVAGVQLEDGQKVLLFLAAANRDPRKWEDPDRFDIRRKTLGHVGFGAGIHGCVGQAVARMEGEIILTELA